MTDGPLSPRNKRVTAARRLLKRAFRAEARAFLVEGPQAVREALALAGQRPGLVRQVFVTGDAESRHPELLAAARGLGVEVDHVGAEVLASLAQTVTPQGVVAVCGFVDVPLAELLDRLRGAEPYAPAGRGAGARARPGQRRHGGPCGRRGRRRRGGPDRGVGGPLQRQVRARDRRARCSTSRWSPAPPVADALAALRDAGLRVVAADGAGERDLDEEADAGTLAAPTAWVFGNEAWGLPEETRALCDAVVRVPIHGRAESLNLATAAAVCLYASARAQR